MLKISNRRENAQTRNNIRTSSITLLKVSITMLEPIPPTHNAVTAMQEYKNKLLERINYLQYSTVMSMHKLRHQPVKAVVA
jgi:hypothetical protein